MHRLIAYLMFRLRAPRGARAEARHDAYYESQRARLDRARAAERRAAD